MLSRWLTTLVAASGLASGQGITLDGSDAAYKAAAKIAAANMLTYYQGNQPGMIPGLLPDPYYWWEAGAMFGQLINYWKFTGDTTYNDMITQAMLHQIGDKQNYMPVNQTKTLGNDDQSFWAFSCMDAAEMGFPDPPAPNPSWVALAQAVWNTQWPVWEKPDCGGGLRWQKYSFNTGWNYKNAISNGGFFFLSARLARYTGNQTYIDWANTAWNWTYTSPIMSNSLGAVYDGIGVSNECNTQILSTSNVQWSYNPSVMIVGAAYMANHTGDPAWTQRVTGLMAATDIFFVKHVDNPATLHPSLGGDIMSETACEGGNPPTCNYDQPSFKAYTTHWLSLTGQLVPSKAAEIAARIKASAVAAAQTCVGAAMGRTTMCGRRWYQSGFDGQFGVGEQMSALSIFQNNLIDTIPGPLTDSTGGKSKSDPGFGVGSAAGGGLIDPYANMPITTGDKAGAGILTLISMVLIAGFCGWIVI